MAGSNGNGTNGHHDEPAPQGMSQPPIDPDKVAEHAQSTDGQPFNTDERQELRNFVLSMERIREEARELNQQRSEAKERLMKKVPLIKVKSLMVAYELYVKAEDEHQAGDDMRATADSLRELSEVWRHPRLFE